MLGKWRACRPADNRGQTMIDPKKSPKPAEPAPRSTPPTIEELLEENERLRVRLALHEYFDASERFEKKVTWKKRRPSKR